MNGSEIAQISLTTSKNFFFSSSHFRIIARLVCLLFHRRYLSSPVDDVYEWLIFSKICVLNDDDDHPEGGIFGANWIASEDVSEAWMWWNHRFLSCLETKSPIISSEYWVEEQRILSVLCELQNLAWIMKLIFTRYTRWAIDQADQGLLGVRTMALSKLDEISRSPSSDSH